MAVGLAILAVISSTVTEQSSYSSKKSPQALLTGYRASFWTCFGAILLSCAICMVGLRDVGKVGLKRE